MFSDWQRRTVFDSNEFIPFPNNVALLRVPEITQALQNAGTNSVKQLISRN
jgi:hypothetical protein